MEPSGYPLQSNASDPPLLGGIRQTRTASFGSDHKPMMSRRPIATGLLLSTAIYAAIAGLIYLFFYR
jgi:hypothetical protein